MDRDSYRAASFLDDRMLQAPVDAQIVPWPEIEAATAATCARDARWIFHIGHVGSTLVSRLLGELRRAGGARAAAAARLGAEPARGSRALSSPVAKLMSRTFAADQIACVKATSFVSEIAPELVPPGERALFMYASPRNYVAGILAGENSRAELRQLAPVPGAADAAGGRVSAVGRARDAELAAVAWACEMTALEAAADAMPDRQIAWADFDAMLADMPAATWPGRRLFGFAADDERLEAIARAR